MKYVCTLKDKNVLPKNVQNVYAKYDMYEKCHIRRRRQPAKVLTFFFDGAFYRVKNT